MRKLAPHPVAFTGGVDRGAELGNDVLRGEPGSGDHAQAAFSSNGCGQRGRGCAPMPACWIGSRQPTRAVKEVDGVMLTNTSLLSPPAERRGARAPAPVVGRRRHGPRR
jgi:hypothetical protein